MFRQSTGRWFVNRQYGFTAGLAIQWGAAGDVPMPADFDGDDTDVAVYRPSTGQWFIKRSDSEFTSVVVVNWGVADDVPMPADYDGDGKADPAVYRPASGLWLVARSSSNYTTAVAVQWGVQALGDLPMPADFDGDGRTDPAIYRPATGHWFILRSDATYSTYFVVQWGNQRRDVPVRESHFPPPGAIGRDMLPMARTVILTMSGAIRRIRRRLSPSSHLPGLVRAPGSNDTAPSVPPS